MQVPLKCKILILLSQKAKLISVFGQIQLFTCPQPQSINGADHKVTLMTDTNMLPLLEVYSPFKQNTKYKLHNKLMRMTDDNSNKETIYRRYRQTERY